ncbi:MAG: hybrid sensor histidine kinase/response regulator [Verrucomicrobiota bacterium]
MKPTARETPRIMIVDDTPQNLDLLETMLIKQGCEVFALPDGEMALQAAVRNPPHLILLDILMPGLDGYEVCTRLKADPQLKHIPVVFLSALNEPWDKVRAFQVGGVDYISKPFQLEEVAARVHSHLELSSQRRELQGNYERLRELERLRDGLVHMLVHDLRSPLTGIRMGLESARGLLPPGDPTLASMVGAALASANSMTEMITQLLDVSRLEAGQMPLHRTAGDLVALARSAQDLLRTQAETRRLRLTPAEAIIANYDPNLLRRVLNNLLGNALKFTLPNGEVSLGISREAGQVRVTVADNGPGIPPAFHQKIFTLFGQVESRKSGVGTGLGLAFCKLAVEAHGGRIGVESVPGQGSTFWFTLPLDPARPGNVGSP